MNKATFQSASKKFKLADIVMTGVSARIIFLSMRFVIWSVGDVFYAPFVNNFCISTEVGQLGHLFSFLLLVFNVFGSSLP